MKKKMLIVGIVIAMAITSAIVIAQNEQQQPDKKEMTYVPADKAVYKEASPGASMAVVWEDKDKGSFGAFTKFVPGFDAGMHSHTFDTRIVVIKGAYLYKDDAGEKRVASGDFLLVPGGHKHWSGGDAKEGALFYVESPGKFDLVPAK